MKVNHFNNFFASHCTPLNNNSKVPGNQTYITDSKFSSLHFGDKDIIKMIRSLDINKAHVHDDISIRMLKICDLAIKKPLSIIFRNCINHSTFPDLWKKSKICPIHKNSDKQIINIYIPVSFERLIFWFFVRISWKIQTIISSSIWFLSQWFLCRSIAVYCP